MEIYNKEDFKKNGIDIEFVADDVSVSYRNVLRGIHGDSETWKLTSCIYGRIYQVVVNCDQESKDFGKWGAFILSDRNKYRILIPPKHGNSFMVLSDVAIYHYKQSIYYKPRGQFTYKWNDPKFNIWWPVQIPIVSQRDEVGGYVE